MILGIDASTVGSGGFQRHLIEILRHCDPTKHNFKIIKIWGTNDILNKIPESVFMVKLTHPLLNGNLFSRYLWQLFFRDSSFKNENINVLLDPIGLYNGKFKPYATMSRNMLIFDKHEQSRFGWSFLRLKFIFLFYTQCKTFKNAQAIIFISEYAKKYIQQFVNYHDKKIIIIHHGISLIFQKEPRVQFSIFNYDNQNPYKFLYVSSVFSYKHHLNVIEVINKLRKKGYPIIIELVGNIGQKDVGDQLRKKILMLDPENEYIFWHKNVGLENVLKFYHTSDAFIFASSCENMPNILIEAMASGLPILCSSNNPMPEFLEDSGLYFDPENQNELENSLKKMIEEYNLRTKLSAKTFTLSKKYNWTICSDKTFNLLSNLATNKI